MYDRLGTYLYFVLGVSTGAPAVSCSSAAARSADHLDRPWPLALAGEVAAREGRGRCERGRATSSRSSSNSSSCTLHGRRRQTEPAALVPSARPGSAIGRIDVQQTLAARQDDPGSSDPCPHRRERLGLRYVPQSLPFRTGPTAVHDCRTLVANGSGSNLTSFERYRQSGSLRCLSYKTLLLPQLSSAPFGTLLPLSSTLRLSLLLGCTFSWRATRTATAAPQPACPW